MVKSKDWTSGFFPGVLWYLYEETTSDFWKDKAMHYTGFIEQEQWNETTHDMGFKINCSVGNGYRLTGSEHYKDVLIQSARTLSKRFNSTVGAIRSWDHNSDKWEYPVIIDNMMNLELLFEATKLVGDSTFYKIAVTHANTTMENHFREDFSSYHVIDYNARTGEVEKKNTHQGYADASSWSRGQAWGLYGFTMCYRYTGDEKYLKMANQIAGFIMENSHLPNDGIPYWDFDAPKIPAEERDASAGAVMAAALYELSTYQKGGEKYKKTADFIVNNLEKYYSANYGENGGFILMHSTGSKPFKSEVDVPLSYADYYFLEAVIRKRKLEDNKELF